MDTIPSKPVVTLPTINVSGTARATLLDDATDTLGALRDALHALSMTPPNVRDYPNQGDITKAMAQHLDRKKRIESVIAELDVLAEHIAG